MILFFKNNVTGSVKQDLAPEYKNFQGNHDIMHFNGLQKRKEKKPPITAHFKCICKISRSYVPVSF